jgi:hypothetical protein
VSFIQRFIVLTVLAAVIGLAALARNRRDTIPGARTASIGVVTLCLATVMAALLVVGVVSSTMLRHVVQVAPIVLALGLLWRRSEWGVPAAAPLFAFWLLVMGAIWLFLLGLARIVSGRFTPIEIALTIVIAGASAWGLIASYQRGTAAAFPLRDVTIATFAVLQLAAMWLSTQPFVASR